MTWNENDFHTIFTVQSLPSKLFFRLYVTCKAIVMFSNFSFELSDPKVSDF